MQFISKQGIYSYYLPVQVCQFDSVQIYMLYVIPAIQVCYLS